MFPELSISLKGSHFEPIDILNNAMTERKGLEENYFLTFVQARKRRWTVCI